MLSSDGDVTKKMYWFEKDSQTTEILALCVGGLSRALKSSII